MFWLAYPMVGANARRVLEIAEKRADMIPALAVERNSLSNGAVIKSASYWMSIREWIARESSRD